MADVRVLILCAAGTNCDAETEFAWRSVGACPERVHIRRLAGAPGLLDQFQILTIPGGFSYGDDVSAGRIFAAQIERGVRDDVQRFVDTGRLVLGICNGFQVLVKAGMLPVSTPNVADRSCTIADNAPPGFQDRWIALRAESGRCPFLRRGRVYEMPIAHGEGRVVFRDAAALDAAERGGRVALRYVPAPNDRGDDRPHNPNGSQSDIAGLCDETGRILGLMPHPERALVATQHPNCASRGACEAGDGRMMFEDAVGCFR
ncbi:MAG: phosphoribosylformylglycinamidine synthase I [Phycisphaerae bacterium]